MKQGHTMRKAAFIGAGMLLAAGFPIVAGSSAGASGGPAPKAVTVNIEGTNIFVRNQGVTTTYHFPDAPTRVAPGGTIKFVNKTNDLHNMTLFTAKDLPIPQGRLVVDSFSICPLCDAVSNLYGNGNGPPPGVQIDNGQIGDDETVPDDADTVDPAAKGLNPPFPVLIEDFDTLTHSNPATPGNPNPPPTIGDSTLVGAPGSPMVTQRTVRVSTVPGTYHYVCTFHPWMQGTIVVSSSKED
jgi:plastocyanin